MLYRAKEILGHKKKVVKYFFSKKNFKHFLDHFRPGQAKNDSTVIHFRPGRAGNDSTRIHFRPGRLHKNGQSAAPSQTLPGYGGHRLAVLFHNCNLDCNHNFGNRSF